MVKKMLRITKENAQLESDEKQTSESQSKHLFQFVRPGSLNRDFKEDQVE